MRKIYLLLFLFSILFFFGQNSKLYYSGTFLNHKDKPQNFLKVHNKSEGIYEMTDEKGFAIISAKVYDTLVWNNGKNTKVIYSFDLYELKTILERQHTKEYVKNIYSGAYDSLVAKKTKNEYDLESSKEILSKNSDHYFPVIRKLKQKNDTIFKLKEQKRKSLIFNGSFTTSFDIKSRNSIPKTQTQYAQGRSENGSLVWKGPETNEMFSFGPDISTLGFDGQPYEFDQNGRLIALSNGLLPSKVYDNNLFKTTVGYNNQLRINAIIKENYNEKFRVSFDLGQQKDQMYFPDQYNIVNTFKTKLTSKFHGYTLNVGFNYEENKATNTNRIGLYNRAYQNSLLTPISFSNAQGLFLNDGYQRSYSKLADNPFFILSQANKYHYRNNIRQFNFNIDKKWGDFKLNISQSYENDTFWNLDEYKPSTYGFTNGVLNERNQKNRLYNSNILGSYELGNGDFRNIFSLNFILNDRKVDVHNSLNAQNYLYQRTSQDYLFNYNMELRDYNDFKIGVNIGNSFYISNTSKKNKYWIPKVNGYFTFENIFNWNNADFKILGAYTEMISEPEITRSYASYATTLLNAQNVNQYFPIQEVGSFKNLSPINTKEWKTGLRLNLGYKISLESEYFNRKITDDVFPVFNKNQLQLKNLADHTYSGYEVNFSYNDFRIGQDFFSTQKVSFFKYKDVVDRVNTGYNNLAVSGFNDIYKTLAEGEVLGAVMGSYFERDHNGQLIIDEFGFPKKADGLKIIADPTPDFVMKFNHSFKYKMFSLDINWEWKKGGQVWNGTQAVLDYYGRSLSSAEQRNIKNYIFEGVHSNGNINQTPVDFYNPNQNVEQNRWTRYGYLGVAEEYVQKADYVRINTISLTANFSAGNFRRALGVTFYVNNIMLWQANKGIDPNQNFYDLDNGKGLDFFNLPSYKTFGCMVSFQF